MESLRQRTRAGADFVDDALSVYNGMVSSEVRFRSWTWSTLQTMVNIKALRAPENDRFFICCSADKALFKIRVIRIRLVKTFK
jgi:hypothetical protein